MFLVLRKRRILSYLLIMVLLLILIFGLTLSLNIWEKSVPTISPIYYGNADNRAISLLVNVDWGENVIPPLLQLLENNKIKATFFVTGRFAEKFPQLVQKIAAQGHEIGNHGFSHPHPNNISPEANKSEILKTEAVFNSKDIKYSKLFAPPYGEHQQHVIKAADELGYLTIMWTVDTIDWQNPSPQLIIKRVVNKVDNGSLILMHPKECTLTALPELITILKEKGFSFCTVSEIVQ